MSEEKEVFVIETEDPEPIKIYSPQKSKPPIKQRTMSKRSSVNSNKMTPGEVLLLRDQTFQVNVKGKIMSIGEIKYNRLLAYNENLSFKDKVLEKVEKLMIEIQQNYFENSEQSLEEFSIQGLRFNEILVTFYRIIEDLNL